MSRRTQSVFDDGKPLAGFPARIDVFIWDPTDDCNMSTFSTIGMSAIPLQATHRAEVHFSIRRLLSNSEKHDAARFLANLAMYPFSIDEPLDWWHTISRPGNIPLYRAAECVLLHPRFANGGWDSIATSEGEVRLWNVVPITQEERALRNIRYSRQARGVGHVRAPIDDGDSAHAAGAGSPHSPCRTIAERADQLRRPITQRIPRFQAAVEEAKPHHHQIL